MTGFGDASIEQVPEALGRRVRAARSARGWTLDQLAEHSGVSRRMIVNVESGSSSPSITTLLRLANGLGLTLADLVSDTDQPDTVTVTGPQDRSPLWQGVKGGAAVMVAATDTPDMLELWDWSLGPGEAHDSEPHRPGTRELIHVLTGAVRLTVGGQTHDLQAGQAAAFPGDVPHGYGNPGRRGARFSLTVFEPRARIRP
jgi:transcriptional regulator with XRE-family HTH domain